MRQFYIIMGGVYSDEELQEYGLLSEPKTAIYGCTDDTLSEDYVSGVIGNYHYGLDIGNYRPSWLVEL